jgi:hypothetical protein
MADALVVAGFAVVLLLAVVGAAFFPQPRTAVETMSAAIAPVQFLIGVLLPPNCSIGSRHRTRTGLGRFTTLGDPPHRGGFAAW